MKFVGCIQARLGSTRLPQKVLKSLGTKTMLECIVDQLKASQIDSLVIATSNAAQDDALVQFATSHHWQCSRDSVDDIISRLLGAVKISNADALVRVWGDCPFICPDVIDAMISQMKTDNLDFIHNSDINGRSFPPGLDIEIYRASLLEQMNLQVTDKKQREFPVEFVKQQKNLRYKLFQSELNYSHIHLTVDYAEDLVAANKLYSFLLPKQNPFFYKTLIDTILETGIDQEFSHSPRNIEYKEYLKSLKGIPS